MTIRKVEVATGISWVEVPEADLRIQCGCPADSIKHLMKRGLVQPVEVGGVAFETGANAILLSDVALQNGSFSNLAEFPVLQMLYRQGMLLPGHPNNTGAKPLLIGAEDQIRAQLEYIRRGNYGLVSEDEMRAAGVGEAEARRWMRLKLKFAFGEIRASRELLETLVVSDQPVEIRGGVTIRRSAFNVFEIAHGADKVSVDLNLAAGERYEPPFQLGYHRLRKEYFAIVHSGDGDGWDVYRPTMSSVLMHQGRFYLVDAGPNIDAVLRSLGIGIQEIAGIFHTHGHDDHFAGLTGLIRADRKIKYFATVPVRVSVARKLAALMSISEDAFGDFFDVHDLKAGTWNDIDGLGVRPVLSPHPVETTVFFFRALDGQGYRTYAHMADIASFSVLEGMLTDDPDAPGIGPDLLERVRRDYGERADVKKLDVGGGLIHGSARDFATDPSDKLILAHRATPLSTEEKEIGCGAPFGTIDVLIPSQSEYSYRDAFEFLRTYYPDAPSHQIQALINQPLVIHNPEGFLGKEGAHCDHVQLILTGQVEVIGGGVGSQGQLTAGAMIGASSIISHAPLGLTYRAASFVTALPIPAPLFRTFIEANGLEAEVRRLILIRKTLRRAIPFAENLSFRALTGLARAAQSMTLEAGETLRCDEGHWLYVVEEGELGLRVNGQIAESAGPNGMVGESCVLFGVAPVYRCEALAPTRLVKVPAPNVATIPVARLRLIELHQRRLHKLIMGPGNGGGVFHWLDDYLIGVPAMDEQHQRLFSLANEAAAEFQAKADPTAVSAALDRLVGFTAQHFAEEERLLERLGDPDRAHHIRIHQSLYKDINELRTRFDSGEVISIEEFKNFFLSWIVFHILAEDRRYALLAHSRPDYAI